MTKTIALLLAMLAAGNSAQAQGKKLPAGTAYAITSKAVATGTDISYQWYRDGQAINGATSSSYTVSAALAYGTNVEFKRGVKSASCVGDVVFSNAVVLTFCNLLLSGVCWADNNVAQPGTFAPRADMYTEFYQWNRPDKAWAASGAANGWTTTTITDPAWTSTPCPEGWRLPTRNEFQALHSAGSTWAVANSDRGNAVAGRFYGANSASCTLPSAMVGCIFLAASGYRYTNGILDSQGIYGLHWTSTQYSASDSYRMGFESAASSNPTTGSKALGLPIRCVR